MPSDEIDQPFDSIESAYDFMQILAETILDATKELKADHDQALRAGLERRAQGIELALFKLKMLNCYVHKSRRALNDLRLLRRLIVNDRLTVEHVLATL